MAEAEIEKAELPGNMTMFAKKANEGSLEVDTRLEAALEQAGDTMNSVAAVEKADPALAARIQPISDSLVKLQQSLSAASTKSAGVVARQQEIIQQVDPAAEPVEGWVSLNFVTLERGRGPGRGVKGVTRERPLRLRSDSNSQSEVLGVLPVGTEVEILELAPNPNWAKIRRL